MKIQKLIIPLCYYSERILDEGHDDQEAADGGQEAVERASAMSATRGHTRPYAPDEPLGWMYARLDGLAQPVQQVLDLARLLPDSVQRALLRPVLGRPSEGARRGHAVATRASHLRHCSGRTVFGIGGTRRKRESKGEAVRLAQLTLWCMAMEQEKDTEARARKRGTEGFGRTRGCLRNNDGSDQDARAPSN